ncbi:COMMD3 [Bugula neritina]|uniref:COMM domain-containing protein 3 n=1 Tax=Bugula neritina TaxID=10212 RepID=A0A7J7JPS7_BUGNE|nr:COMMD3 [Bugula neritina]
MVKLKDDEKLSDVHEKRALFGLTSFLLECAKQNVTLDEIRAVLEESNFSPKRIQHFLDVYHQHKDSIRRNLARISSFEKAQIVDVNWRLDYNIKNSQSDKVNQLSYLVDLHTLHPGESEIKIVSMACSLEQLQDLVGKLKDAVRCVEKQVSS